MTDGTAKGYIRKESSRKPSGFPVIEGSIVDADWFFVLKPPNEMVRWYQHRQGI